MNASRCFTLFVAALCCAPFAALLWMGGESAAAPISEPIARFIPDYVFNSFCIAIGTGALALLLGGYTAWAVVRYEFAGRRYFEWALLLPLAMPAYLIAMVYGHQLDVAGPVQSALRDMSGLKVGEYAFPNIRSLGGVILVLALSLYPYVYLTAKYAFANQSRSHFEAAWLAGLPPERWLWRIALPIARPALALGAALVIMEALADFGVVSLFGVPSFTTGIYRAWYGLGVPQEAAKLALMLLAIVALVIGLERASRGRLKRMSLQQNAGSALARAQGNGWHMLACALPVILGFIIPFVQFAAWGVNDMGAWADALHWQAAGYALLVALLSATMAVIIAGLFAYALRAHPPRWQTALLRLASLGYAIPGSVIAVAIFLPLLMLDKSIANSWESATGVRPELVFTGSVAAMIIACTIRFLAIAMANVEAGLVQVSPELDDAAKLLGTSHLRVKRELHWPQMRLIYLAAGFMVFADTLKELPASLLLRPFNVSTLSIRTYELASDGQLMAAAIPALMMIAIGLVAVAVMVGFSLGRETTRSKVHLPKAATPVYQ